MKRLLPLACLAAAISTAAAETKLSADAQAKLDANGLVVVDQPLRQGFSAYLGSEHPVFITSDSLLMAYHRVFEEMVGEIEAGQVLGFRDLWRELWKNLPTDPGKDAEEASEEGLHRARLLMATTSRLLTGELPEGLSETETAVVTAEVERVEKGEGVAPPAWILADPKPEDHVSYAAFQPGGLYEGRETMERYYRFRKWLQEMQVDPANKASLAMIGYLRIPILSIREAGEDQLLTPLEYPFAPGDFERGVLNRLPEICEHTSENSHRAALPRISSDIGAVRRIRLFGVLHPGGCKITRALVEKSAPGSSQAQQSPVAVGHALGNVFAGSLLDPALQEAVTQCGDFSLNEESHLFCARHYFEALRALNAPVDERAPALLRSQPWQLKQLNATLGSWTEYRYALLLGSREHANYFGLSLQEPGFVEPFPGFYRQLGESAEAFATLYRHYRTPQTVRGTLMLQLQDTGKLLRQVQEARLKGETPASEVEDRVRVHIRLLYDLFPDLQPRGWGYPAPLPSTANCGKMADGIDALAKSVWDGDPQVIAKLASAVAESPDPVSPRLSRLAGLCFRLEAMAERQLAKRPWTDPDKEFFQDYGQTLGWLMFYEGNSYLSPRDDAPRIVRYASETGPDSTRIFHAATSQPRLLLIRYPNPAGEEILCQGAVYAYRNVERNRTPTRAEWQAEAKASAWPEWMKPIVGIYTPPAEK